MGKYPASRKLEQAFSGSYTSLVPLSNQGAQALVFRAYAAAGSKPVILKLYDPDDTIEERTEREVEALRSINCDTLVELHDAGEIVVGNKRYRFLATTFIEGENLAAAIKGGPFAIEHVVQIGIDVASAIEMLWRMKIVHRDIKPA